MAEFNKRELVVLAKRCFENSQFEDVINYMKEVISSKFFRKIAYN